MRICLDKNEAKALANDIALTYKNKQIPYKLSKLRDGLSLTLANRKWSSWTSNWDDSTVRYYSIQSDLSNYLPDSELAISELKSYKSEASDSVIEMHFNNINMAGFDEGSTIEITVTSNEQTQTFYVQTVDGKHRTDLGCWILTETDHGDVHEEDYPDFDLDKIIDIGEKFLRSSTEEILTDYRIDNRDVYLLVRNDHVDIVTRNNNFINSATSSYQREFSDPIKTLDDKEEALEYLNSL